MSSVELSKIVKSYADKVPVVHGIDLKVEDGEFMVLVGPSGCGKSTTLRMIAGLEEITGGELQINGKIVNEVAPKDRNIAMVFQNYALYPHMTVYENIAFGLKLAKLPTAEIDLRVKDVAKTLEIEHLLNRKPKDMSGGQRQRVALGRAIARRAAVYLFDEPLSNLDAQLRVSMRVRLAQLHKDLKDKGLDHTMIYVTHDQVEAMTLGHRICVMESGYIRQLDTPLNLYRYPANKFVAEFIGSPSMNMTEGILEKEGNTLVINFKTFKTEVPVEKHEQLEQYVGKKVGVGIRSEHININNHEVENSYKTKIDVAERMGNEDFIYFKLNDILFVMRTSVYTENIQYDKEYYFSFDGSNMHIFDLETEENISLPKERLTKEKAGEIFDFETRMEELIKWLGGKENILDMNNCITRLRLTIKDMKKIDRQSFLRAGVKALFADKGQVQVVVGKKAGDVLSCLKAKLGI